MSAAALHLILAFRIGQHKNVLVHKFVCRGTIKDKILDLVALDIRAAQEDA